MTNAQQIVEDYRIAAAPISNVNIWRWTQRAVASLEKISNSTIGHEKSRAVSNIVVFRCADGSRFAYDQNGARQVWAMPA